MKRDGKSLENFIRQIEELHLPPGSSVEANRLEHNDDGIQVAEFDVFIKGKLGTTEIVWLIECRDRPSSGAAPGSWIEQLIGRRQRFGFHKVTAVSTTGFTAGAEEAARDAGIETRSVSPITVEEVESWMVMKEMTLHSHQARYDEIRLLLDPSEGAERYAALAEVLKDLPPDARFLRSTSTGQTATAAEALQAAISGVEDHYQSLEANGPPKSKRMVADYPNEHDHFVVDTAVGPIRIAQIAFLAEFSLTTKSLPPSVLQEYKSDNGERISQSAIFPVEINHQNWAFELHNLGATGETHVLLRRMPDPSD